MSLVLKKTGLLCCVFFFFFFSLSVSSEHTRRLGGDFHTVNHVYLSAEKVQFALHLFPKADHFVLWPGTLGQDRLTHDKTRSSVRPFSSFSIYCKKVFSYTTKNCYFQSFLFLFIRPMNLHTNTLHHLCLCQTTHTLLTLTFLSRNTVGI